MAPSIRKSWQELHWQAAVARSIGIVRLQTKAMEFSLVFMVTDSHRKITFEHSISGQLTRSLKDFAVSIAAEVPVTWSF
jgi:hypothetical protein